MRRESPPRDSARLVFMGDGTIAPEELEYQGGEIYQYGISNAPPSTYWLKRLSDRFPHSVWLNPIPRDQWESTCGHYTLNRLREFFHMGDMTLGGIKGMVEFLSEK